MMVLVTLLIDDHSHWNGTRTLAHVLIESWVFSAQISAGAVTIITAVPYAAKNCTVYFFSERELTFICDNLYSPYTGRKQTE